MHIDGDEHFLTADLHVAPLLVSRATVGPIPVGPSQYHTPTPEQTRARSSADFFMFA